MVSNILVIDDSLTVRAIIEQLLASERDLRVIASASDVVGARKLIAHYAPSLITLDLAMPGIDGMTFLDELTAGPGPHPAVLVLSSHAISGSPIELDALARGATACFDKAQLVRGGKKFARVIRRAIKIARAHPTKHHTSKAA
jgi:two-component system chemotaxis response regulator CheB